MLSGNVDDWAQRKVEEAATVYAETPEGSKLGYNEVARWAPVIEDSFLSGGLRLAHILNSIFDPAYPYRRSPSSF